MTRQELTGKINRCIKRQVPYLRHLSQLGSLLSHFLFDALHFSQAREACTSWVYCKSIMAVLPSGELVGRPLRHCRGTGDLLGDEIEADVDSDTGV
jgi:hypothetical protein